MATLGLWGGSQDNKHDIYEGRDLPIMPRGHWWDSGGPSIIKPVGLCSDDVKNKKPRANHYCGDAPLWTAWSRQRKWRAQAWAVWAPRRGRAESRRRGGHGYLNIDEHCIFILSLLHRLTPDAHT